MAQYKASLFLLSLIGNVGRSSRATIPVYNREGKPLRKAVGNLKVKEIGCLSKAQLSNQIEEQIVQLNPQACEEFHFYKDGDLLLQREQPKELHLPFLHKVNLIEKKTYNKRSDIKKHGIVYVKKIALLNSEEKWLETKILT